jgi:F-type H+-transporting ATPase subunit delta
MPQESPDIEQYAMSLLAMGQATHSLPRIENDLVFILDLIENNEEVRRFLANPHVTDKGKYVALDQILSGKIHAVLLHFLLILMDQKDLHNIKTIAEAFFRALSNLQQKATGQLVTAAPLSDDKIALIEKEIGRVMGKEVHLTPRVNPGILGGILVQVENTVFDHTIDHQLESIRQALIR